LDEYSRCSETVVIEQVGGGGEGDQGFVVQVSSALPAAKYAFAAQPTDSVMAIAEHALMELP